MPPPTSGMAIMSTSVRAGSDIATFVEPLGLYIVQKEACALRGYAPPDDAARRKHEGFIQELLGEFPMMGGRPAADVALIEERWYENPGIYEHLFATGQVQGDGNVKSVSYPP